MPSPRPERPEPDDPTNADTPERPTPDDHNHDGNPAGAPGADSAESADLPGVTDRASGGADPRETAYGLLQRGSELMKSRHHAQAATVLARAARLEPRKGSILEALGRAYYNSGQHGRAAETFESLLEVDPSAHYAHYALGQSLKQLGRVREARTHLRLAVALSPNSRLYQAALDRLGPATERD